MGILVNFSLVILGTLAFAVAFNYLFSEKNNIVLQRGIFFMGCFSTIWCYGYALMGFTDDFSLAFIGRTIGIIGVLGFIATEGIFLLIISNIFKSTRKLIISVLLAFTIADFILFSNGNILTFIRINNRTCYYASPGLGRSFHAIYIAFMLIFMVALGTKWYMSLKFKRDKMLVSMLAVANIFIIVTALPDTVFPLLNMPSFPSSCYGSFLALMTVWIASSRYNVFSISVQNISSYIYKYVNSAVLAFDSEHKLVMVNDFGKTFLNVDDNKIYTLPELFEISINDTENIFANVPTDDNYSNDYRLMTRTGNTICSLQFTVINDMFNDPYCYICFIYDLTKEEAILDEVNRAKDSLELNLNEKTRQVERLTLQAITTIANTIDAKDPYTKGHSIRVAEYSALLAAKLDWSNEEIQNLKYIALLHDIGKIGVPDAVLNKPGKLSDVEFDLIKSHTTIGGNILKDITLVKNLDAGAKYHHERFDGSGYPFGLKGEEIPLIARIICIADAYDAMNSKRVYRNSLPPYIIREQLVNGRGTQFDPLLLNLFLELFDSGALTAGQEIIDNINLIDSESNKLLSQIITNIEQERKKSNEIDPVTGLLNRNAGELRIIEAMKKAPGCLAFIDLDNLKNINDIYGHLSGDYALKTLGDVLSAYSHNAIVARIGGDEFLYYMKNIDEDGAISIINGIIHSFRSRKEKDTMIKGSSLSIGLCLTTPNDTYDTVYQKADKALYYIKQNGKDDYYFYNNSNGNSNPAAPVDLKKLVNSILAQGSYTGALGLDYREFTKISEFINNMAIRYHRNVQLLMITVEPSGTDNFFLEHQEAAMSDMEAAIKNSLRNVDACTRFSSEQFLVILTYADKENIEIIINRIFNHFYKIHTAKDVTLNYDFADLTNTNS